MKLRTDRVGELLANADAWHEAFARAETFGGPSLYLHRRALDTRHSPASLQHLEYVYATLASWGMHRMGAGGSKVRTFDAFRDSVGPLAEKILSAQDFEPGQMDEPAWATMKAIFSGLRIMASSTSLVGNSKVVHHMLPNIVPPIDREYTLRYLCGNTTIANDVERERQMMKQMISGFFIPVTVNPAFAAKAELWIAAGHPWDTSVMKIIDKPSTTSGGTSFMYAVERTGASTGPAPR
jgi:hypothetical protein